jgi:hypothetical protein
MSRGAPNWFKNVSTYCGKVIEYWTKNSLNSFKSKQKVIGEFGPNLVLLEIPWWIRFIEGELGKF